MSRRHYTDTKACASPQLASKVNGLITEKYRLKDENEALKEHLMLGIACQKHYKQENDILRRKHTVIVDAEVKEDNDVLTSFPSMKTNLSEPQHGCLRSSFNEVYDNQKPKLNNHKMQQLENENKTQDTHVQELEVDLFKQKTENRHLQAEMNDRVFELAKVREQLQLAFADMKENEDTLNKMRTERIQQNAYIKQLQRKVAEKKSMLERKEKECNERDRTQSKIIQQLQAKLERSRFNSKGKVDVSLNQDSVTNGNCKENLDAKKREKQLWDQLQLALKTQKETENELEDVKKLKDIEQTSKEELERKVRKYENDLKQIESRHKETITPQHLAIQRLELDIKNQDQEVKSLKKSLESTTGEARDCKLLRLRLEETESMLSALKNEHFQNSKRLKQTLANLDEMKKERDSDRLSNQNLEKKIHQLEKEIVHLHYLANQKKKISEMSKLEDKEVFETKEELKKREFQITSLDDQLQKTRNKLKETESELRETKTSHNDLQKQVQCLEKEIKQLHLKASRREAVSKTSKMEDGERIEMEEELKKRGVQITRLIDQLQQEKVKLTETEYELQETKTRLSKAMGDMLTDNNPNIAELSDKNRPLRVAERFGELYDNQWTDACDIIGKYFDTEERTLGELLNILQEIFCFCKTSWAKQMEDLLKVLWFSATPEDVPEVNKILKGCNRTTVSVAMGNLYEIYIARLQHSGDKTSRIALEIRPFVKECLEICWLMMIQDPPVVFAPNAARGSKLNTDIYKTYTKSGTHVEYTVWPAMLLHENGPVLAKGVAQGYKKNE